MSSILRRIQRRAMRKMGYTRETWRAPDENGNARPLRVIAPNGIPVGLTYPFRMLPEHLATEESSTRGVE
jgi:hypothetical protein